MNHLNPKRISQGPNTNTVVDYTRNFLPTAVDKFFTILGKNEAPMTFAAGLLPHGGKTRAATHTHTHLAAGNQTKRTANNHLNPSCR